MVESTFPAVALLLVLVTLWHLLAVALDSTVFPTPVESVGTLGADLASATFLRSLSQTIAVLAASYALAVVVGAVLGFLIGLSAFWSDVLSPLLYAVYSIPKITLYPLFLVFLGLGDSSRLGFAFLHGVIPMLLIVLGATAGVDRIHLKLAASLGLSTTQLLRRIVIPSIIPSLVTGMRLTFGLTFLGVLIAELLGGSAGLGSELLRNVQLVRMGNIVGEVALIAIIALVPTMLLLGLEHRVTARFAGKRGPDEVAV
jgi:NitT/TauT family transport system permease protein